MGNDTTLILCSLIAVAGLLALVLVAHRVYSSAKSKIEAGGVLAHTMLDLLRVLTWMHTLHRPTQLILAADQRIAVRYRKVAELAELAHASSRFAASYAEAKSEFLAFYESEVEQTRAAMLRLTQRTAGVSLESLLDELFPTLHGGLLFDELVGYKAQ